MPGVVVKPRAKHTHTIINLHNRNTTAEDYSARFLKIEDEAGKTLPKALPTTKWVFPSAPKTKSGRFGSLMSQWFDMWFTANPHELAQEQESSLRDSVATITQLIREEAAQIGMQNVILFGTSQGAATAITALLEGNLALCGFVGLSGWMPEYASRLSCRPRVPVFLSHCQDDVIIDLKYCESMAKELAAMPVETHIYPSGGQWVNVPEGVKDLLGFLEKLGVPKARCE